MGSVKMSRDDLTLLYIHWYDFDTGEPSTSTVIIRGRITESKAKDLRDHLSQMKETLYRGNVDENIRNAAQEWLDAHGIETQVYYWEQIWI
jgi:hypothetical protein